MCAPVCAHFCALYHAQSCSTSCLFMTTATFANGLRSQLHDGLHCISVNERLLLVCLWSFHVLANNSFHQAA
jgi:hypothetical protein